MTHYDVLGVALDADRAQIKQAYRRLLRQTHPDTGGDSARFMAVRDAWRVLSDPVRRQEYDAALVEPAASESPPGSGTETEPEPAPTWGEEHPLDEEPAPPARDVPAPHAPIRPLPPHWIATPPAPTALRWWHRAPWSIIAIGSGAVAMAGAVAQEALPINRPGVLFGHLVLLGATALAAWRIHRGSTRTFPWLVLWIGSFIALATGSGSSAEPTIWAVLVIAPSQVALMLWAVALPTWVLVTRRSRLRHSRARRRYADYLIWVNSRREHAENWDRLLRSRHTQGLRLWRVQNCQRHGNTTRVLLHDPETGTFRNDWAWGHVNARTWILFDPKEHVVRGSATDVDRTAWAEVHDSPRPAFVP